MAAFLSPGWIEEMNDALGSSPALSLATREVTLSIQQVVRAGDMDHCYVVRVDRGRVTVETGRTARADVTVTEDMETAVALARGEMSPQVAFMLGRIRVTGDMAALMAGYQSLVDQDAALAPVRARATY